MRVLIINAPVPRRTYTVVPLAAALRAAGHQVVFAGQPDAVDVAAALGFDAVAVGDPFPMDDQLRYLTPPGVRPLRYFGRPDPALLQVDAKRWTIHARYTVQRYQALAADLRPDFLLSNTLDHTAGTVAAGLGVPWAQLRFGSDPEERLGSELNEVFTGEMALRLGSPLPEPLMTVDPVPASLQVGWDTAARPIRPVAWTSPTERAECLLPAARGERVAVTVARHTLEYHGLEFARGVVAALAADRHRQVVAGIEPLFHAALGEQPANVRLTTPHALAVLAPTCRAVVHDGDALTVLEWAATGVPQLALPQLVDECAIAERLAATGAGRVLREADEQEDPAAVQELVRAVIDDRAHAAAAERLREDVLAMPAPATLARELQDQVRAA